MKWALVGSAPASVRNAPYQDPSWKIIGCSPGVYGVAPRVDEWVELHLWEPGQPWFSPEYVQWLTALPARGVTLWVGGPVPGIPQARLYPFEAVHALYNRHGRWWATSSLFWMMARAIEAIKDEAVAQGRAISAAHDKIAFYGVDMAADSEYEMQRAGIHRITEYACDMGIEVGAPPESDLFTPRFSYGQDEWTHGFRKTRARDLELESRLQQAEQQVEHFKSMAHFLRGAREDLKYMRETWIDKGSHLGPAVVAPPAPAAPPPDGYTPHHPA